MVNINEAFPSNWIAAHDLNGKDITLVISKSNVENLGQGTQMDRKLCIWFNATEKGMALNVIGIILVSLVALFVAPRFL